MSRWLVLSDLCRLETPRTVASLDDDDNVIVIAEFLQILPPALLVDFMRIDQVAAFGAIMEKLGGGEERNGAATQSQD